jgi:glycosyltransferase involved in cell wall biosynthesis
VRILYHHRTLADGAEGIHIASMVQAFRDLGHTVLLLGVAPGGPEEGQRQAVARFRSVVPKAGFELASVAFNVPDYVRVRSSIRQFRPDLLYKRHSRFDVAALAAARRAGIPSVLEVNCLFTQGAYERFEPVALRGLAVRLERQALTMATIVAAVSTPLADQIRALAGRPAVVIPNGADPERFNPARADPERVRARHHLAGRLIVGWTGILRDWHGLDLLLDAVSAVRDVTLLIVGDGPARASVEERAAACRIGDRVVITGRVAHGEMPDYMAAMDIAVVADERTGVASPMKLLEYMAMGRAVVAPRAANIRDVVEEGVDGLLFEPGSARELAAAVQKLAGDAPLRHALGQAARSKVERERNWSRIGEGILVDVTRV